ncbi:MAG TPA: 3-deoxy-D-manno-octulosonic acid kinase [Povalibacter sp.]|nr:3-deoxy-D-manno-octulosonic acid kinase [Povalibacter sp.]
MAPIVERQLQLPGSGILYDASRLRKPAQEVFTREYWASRGSHVEVAGGRASVSFIRTEEANWVLRHYRRGGLIAKLFDDQYLWLGASRTRSFTEWRLLAELYKRELPVPAPVAARYVRSGLVYRADLITEELPPSKTLANLMAELDPQAWQAVGKTVARFHAQGVYHADLNAHNILLGESGVVYVLDFDRGRIRARGAWEEQVLARLKRSLEKIARQRAEARFSNREWDWLMEGYAG